MATKLFLRNTTLNGIGANYYDMVKDAGASSATFVVSSVNSGTDIQWTDSGGGNAVCWVSGRVPSGGFTLQNSDVSIWAHESATGCNAGGRIRVFKRTALGVETDITGTPFDDGVEFTKATPTEMTWTADVTDTAFAEDDRVLVKLYITNIGTMGNGTCTLTFNAADAATGDTFFNIAQTVAFKYDPYTVNATGDQLAMAGATQDAVALKLGIRLSYDDPTATNFADAHEEKPLGPYGVVTDDTLVASDDNAKLFGMKLDAGESVPLFLSDANLLSPGLIFDGDTLPFDDYANFDLSGLSALLEELLSDSGSLSDADLINLGLHIPVGVVWKAYKPPDYTWV